MRHQYSMKYQRILLRPLEGKDIESLRIWRNDPANSRFLRKIPYITPEDQKQWYDDYLEDPDIVTFAVEAIEDSSINPGMAEYNSLGADSVKTECTDPGAAYLSRMVGSLSLYHFGEDGSAELGKVLIGDPKAHGKGIGRMAVEAAVRIAVEQMKKRNIYLHVNPLNGAAMTIYRQAGFHRVEAGRLPLAESDYEIEMIFDEGSQSPV